LSCTIASELEALGHTPHVYEWEVKGSDDIYAWMEARHDAADHVLCVVSDEYLKAPFSTLERNAALWQAASKRPGFVLLIAVKPCRLPTLVDHLRRCELFGIPEAAARLRFRDFMAKPAPLDAIAFPGKVAAVSNIPIRVPEHFMGRDAEAQRRTAGSSLPVTFEVGNAMELRFEDGTFDGWRTERMLMHVPEPIRALSEMVRVTKTGGRVSVFDFDWDTVVIDSPHRETTRRIVSSFSDSMRSGWIGRQLRRMFLDRGMIEVAVVPLQIFIGFEFLCLLIGGHLTRAQQADTLDPPT
jgi:SAM-dependent methyltransferase